MDKFKKIMVGFFMLASVNFVSINCFAMKNKNKSNKIVNIKSEKSGEKESNTNMQNILKGKRTRNDVKRKRKNKQKKIVNIKSDVKQLSGEKESNTNMQNMLKTNDVKQKENNGVIEKSEDKFKLVNIKNGIFNIKEIIEEIKLNILKYLSVSLFNKKIDKKKIGKILKENHINYSNFSFCCDKKNNYKYSFKIIAPNLKEVNDTVKKNIKNQIEKYFNFLRKDVFCGTLITKLKAIKKKEYEMLKNFVVRRTKERFHTNDEQDMNYVIDYIFDELKEEKGHSKYLEILKKEDIKLSNINFYDTYKSENGVKKESKSFEYKKCDDKTIAKLNILNFLAIDIIKDKLKKQDIEDIFTKNNVKEYEGFCITSKKNGKTVSIVFETFKPKKEVELNEETKNKISEQIKEYFNGMKDDVLGDTLIENLKKLEINSSKYNKMKASLEDTIKKYFSKDANVNFENIFDELKNEKDHSKYLEILKEFDLVRYVTFKKDKVYENKKKDCNVKLIKINMLKILAKDEFKNCLGNFSKEYKDINISAVDRANNIKYHLYLSIPESGKINLDSKKGMIKTLRDCLNKEKKEIFKKVFENLKTIDIKGEEYNNMINKLEKMCKKYFIIKDGQNVKEMLKDIFDNLTKETKYDDYLTSINNNEILDDIKFSNGKKKNNKEKRYEEEEDVEGVEEDVEEENMEEENIEKSDEEENIEEENMEKSDEEKNIEEENIEKSDEEENMEEENIEKSDEEKNMEEENVEKSDEENVEEDVKEENMEEENIEKSDEEKNMEEEGNKYKRLRAMNEYKNTYPLNYLNDVNEFVEIMEGLKEYNIISNKDDSKEKELNENGGYLEGNILKEYDIILNKNGSKEKELDENDNYLEENILKEKTNENFNFNPNEITYNKYEKDFNLNDNDNNDNNDNDNILYKIFK